MANQELLAWIRQQMVGGATKEQIKAALLQSGWKEQDIDEAFRLITEGAGATSPLSSQKITKLPGALTLLGEAWNLWTKRLGTFLGVLVVPVLILAGIIGLLAGGAYSLPYLLSTNFFSGGVIALVVFGILSLIAIVISNLWGTVAFLYAIKDSEERIGVREAYRRARGKIWSYWWLLFLSGFIVLGAFLLFIVPGIMLAVSFSFAIFVLVAEDFTGMNALLKSREYVKGIWWKVFWRVLVIVILSVIFSLIISYAAELSKVPVLSFFGNIIVSLFITPLVAVYMFLLYRSVRALKGEIPFTPTRASRTEMIVLGVIGFLLIPGIILGIMFMSLGTVRERGQTAQRDALRSSHITQIYVLLEMYWDKHKKYPASLDELSEKAPLDPSTQKPYEYRQLEGGKNYEFCVQMERSSKKCFP